MTLDAAIALPLLAGAVLALTAGWLGRRLPPATAVRLLTLAATSTAAASWFVLAVLAFTFAAQHEPVATIGHWSARVLHALDPVPSYAGVPAGLAVAALAGAAVARAGRAVRDLWVAQSTCRQLGPGARGLVVVDDSRPDAYAVPGVRGRVVVSTAMLRALPAAERRVLLAHEASHLRHRHHLYVVATDVAAAADPLLRPVARALRAAVERWADEDAAAAVADRRLAARALARAALARTTAATAAIGAQRPRQPVLAADGGSVVERTRALLAPAPRPRRVLAAALAALAVAVAASTVVVDRSTDHRFDRAGISAVASGRIPR